MLTLMLVFGVTLLAFLLVIAGMAVGVMMGRREISGSCGGLANQTNEAGETSCSLCSNPDAACKELKERMQGESCEVSEVVERV
ncbi:MAG: (Na+)-NQR maturation NqrM [Planctomycetota bacterium]